ncbi:MAG: radical SAM protein [Candidatus Diapherotrites archaeon]
MRLSLPLANKGTKMEILNPFVSVLRRNENVALFHHLTLQTVYLSKTEFEEMIAGTLPLEETRALISKNFLVSNTFDENKYFEQFKKSVETNPTIRVAYLLLTNQCNFRCKYCFIETRTHLQQTKTMSKETAQKAIDLIGRNTQKVRIIFYGGEPLLCRDVLKFAVEYAEKRIPNASFGMVCNGSLVTDEIAQFLKAHHFGVGISLDGPKTINDKMRILSNGSGTFALIKKGIKTLQKNKVNTGLSVTLGPHNVNSIEKTVEEIKEANVNAMGFNLLSPNEGVSCEAKKIYNAAIRGEEMLRQAEIREDRVFNRKIEPYLEEKPRWRDCAGYGNQIVITPEGNAGVCHGLWPDLQNSPEKKEYFPIDVDYQQEVTQHPLWQEWFSRMPLNMETCRHCPAIGLCAGGCAKNALLQKGSIWETDELNCAFAKACVEKLVWDYFDGKLPTSTGVDAQ